MITTRMITITKDDTENTASPAQRISYKKDGVTTLVMAGLQGAGKTTFCAKLAKYLTVNEVDYDAVEAMEEEERKSTLSTRLPKSQRKVRGVPSQYLLFSSSDPTTSPSSLLSLRFSSPPATSTGPLLASSSS